MTFYTSLYGRIGYLTMTLMSIVVGAMLLFPLCTEGVIALVNSFSSRPFYAFFAWAIMLLVFVWTFVYSFTLFIRPGWRVICDQEGIQHRGLFKVMRFKWAEIESFRLNYAGSSPLVFLQLRVTKQNKKFKRYGLDVSGLSPNYDKLYSVVFLMAQKANAKAPAGLVNFDDLDL